MRRKRMRRKRMQRRKKRDRDGHRGTGWTEMDKVNTQRLTAFLGKVL